MVMLVWGKRVDVELLGGGTTVSTVHGRVLDGCVMCRVHMQGHRVPSDAILILWVDGLFFERPNASSELFYPVTAIIYTTFFPFKKELRLCKWNAI